MWVIKTEDGVESPFMFRILPGSIKTIGRATRADFIVDSSQGFDAARAQVSDILRQVAKMPKRRR